MSPRKPRSKLGIVVARTLLGMVAAAATSVVLVGQFGRGHHTLDQFNSALSLLLPVLAVTLAGSLRLRDRAGIAVAVLGLMVGGYQLGGAALTGIGRPGPAPGETIKVMTYSTFHANPDPAAVARVITAEAPDVAVLQETNGTPALIMDGLLPGYARIRSCLQPHCSLTILSRWPMRRIEPGWQPKLQRPDVLVGEIDGPAGPFRIIDLHMPRPYDVTAQRLLAITGALARDHAGTPLIVAGDFNTATGSFGLARFARISGLRRVDGFIPTYPADQVFPAFAGIDHVFTSLHWARGGCHRTAAGQSDHYGIACRIGLRAPR